MDINDLTIKQAKELAAMFTEKTSECHPYEVGRNYFIRTVTHYYTGRLESVYDHELVISDAAWIADTGRYADALKSGNFSEVEPYPEGKVIIGRGAILDCSQLSTTLPRSQK
jgi:hypothetical protein